MSSPIFHITTVLGLVAAAALSVGCGESDATHLEGEAWAEQPGPAGVVRAGGQEAGVRPERVDFNRDIRPILSENCFACHGADAHEAKADVQLHNADFAHDGYLIVPGERGDSEVWLRITDERDPMPPADSHKALTAEQKALIGRWIDQGAQYMPHWAYVAPQMTPTPQVDDAAWPEHWIDHYILARLEAEGLFPVDDAGRVAQIRRLSFDLTGLPPTPDEVDAFVSDAAPDAYEKVVDRLLASPRFGERMAAYWLDIVRFADTVGYHGDQTQSITPYRDWVIWAFNQNLPYDTFVKHQLAGDLVEGADTNSLVASAYNRLYQSSHEGGIQRAEYEAMYDADRVSNFGDAFMGATIGCARCHDHKYDPITDEDFYSLAAFFGQVDDLWHLPPAEGGRFSQATNTNPTPRHPEIEVLSPLDQQRIEQLEQRLSQATTPAQRRALQQQIDAIKPRKVMISKQLPEDAYRAVRFLPAGNWLDNTGPIMPPAVPAFLGEIQTQEGQVPTRLDLANWLVTNIEHGGSGELNARVMVNRLWYLMFGDGLTTSLGDFGGQGVPPTYPALLDRLALEFVESGWDIKAMMKTLAMSRTYRLSSEPTSELLRVDQNNVLFARQSQDRLPAEMIRDNALWVSGLLVEQLGGDSARPYQPEGYYTHLNFPVRRYKPNLDNNQWRRGVYTHWQRQFLHPMLKAFDAPSREICTAKRSVSNTPLMALVLMNDPTFVEASRNFAQRVLTEGPATDRERLDWAMRQVLSREASDDEAAILLGLLAENRRVFSENRDQALELISVGLSPRDQSLSAAEHAAWTEVCRVLLNLHETITRP
ncbi:MAG: PSD1 and planctomycete cytochrome C domain-containing protein [Planctomycetota bacterium]